MMHPLRGSPRNLLMKHSFAFADAAGSAGSTYDRQPADPVTTKLELTTNFDRVEREALRRALRTDQRTLHPRTPLIEAGDTPTEVHVVLEGWACRYRRLSDGTRQIVALHLPGDICDLDACLTDACVHPVDAIDTLRVAGLSRKLLASLTAEHPRIERAFRWESMASASVQREWAVNVGRRNARQRVGHLLCELATRLSAVGNGASDSFAFPLTQRDVADACGITPVHANRTLQDLRATGLITLSGRMLTIHDRPALEKLADFNPAYLRLGSALLQAPTTGSEQVRRSPVQV